ncbi:MAG: hypothetical protein C0434_12835 [Xanthomonadaceae bacterium]|nr:hypothetical protein [Xanthomonadaceae bacterium]
MKPAIRTDPSAPPLVVPVITRAQSLRGVKPIAQPYPKWAQQPTPDPDEGGAAAVADPLPPDPAVSRPKVKPMSKPEPIPPTVADELPASDAVASPAPAAPLEALESMLDAVAGPRFAHGVRVHRTKPDGSRGEMLFQLDAREAPEVLRERLGRHGPGEYELAPVVDGRYSGQARRMTIGTPASSAAAVQSTPPTAAPAPAGFDVAGLLAGLASLQRESQAAQAAQFERMQSAAKDSQIEMLKMFLAHRPDGGGASGDGAVLKMLMQRLADDPIERMVKLAELQRLLREDAAPSDPNAQVLGGLAQALPAILAASNAGQAGAQPVARRVVRAVAPASAPVLPVPQQPAAAAHPLADAAGIVLRLARKRATASDVLGTLAAVLDDAELSQAVSTIAGTADPVAALIGIEPGLADHREWLSGIVAELPGVLAGAVSDESGPA